jgi:chlorite dismutase
MGQRDTGNENAKVDVAEKGRSTDGRPTRLDRRLFMQLLAYGGCADTSAIARALEGSGVAGVLYRDLADPLGVALLTCDEDPSFFVTTLRKVLQEAPFRELTFKPEFTMTGRTYAVGYETDLERVLIHRPTERVMNPDWPWAVWYPLRRSGAFEQLDTGEQREVLMEHARIGSAFSEAGHGADIRLACHGLDRNDNDFVIGLLGQRLHPLSAMVQAMRGTAQTSRYLARLGPFFIGHVETRVGP